MPQADTNPKLHSNCFAYFNQSPPKTPLRVSHMKARILQHIQNTMTVVGSQTVLRDRIGM